MSDDLKTDLLVNLTDESLRARLQAATITEPPDPCVVSSGLVSTRRAADWLVIEKYAHEDINLTRDQAAALIPALQAFVREGGA